MTDVGLDVANTNRAPVLTPESHQVRIGQALTFVVQATDPDAGDTLRYTATDLPPGATLDAATGRFAWTPAPGQTGEYVVTWTVSDGGLSASATSLLRAVVTPTAPAVTIDLTPSFPVTPGTRASVRVLGSSLAVITGRTLKVNGMAVALDDQGRFEITPVTPGRISLEATATDADGLTSTTTSVLRVRDPLDTLAPVVRFDGALAGLRLTSAVDVVATVEDRNLDAWTLEVARFGTEDFTILASGHDGFSASAITRFDPRAFTNGFYTLRLTASDIGGRSARAMADVEVQTALKPSVFRYTVTDLQVALGDQTISLMRAYDSLDRDGGSFGPGWRLVNRATDLQTDVAPTGREALGNYNPFRTGTRLYLTTPTGERVGFTFAPVRRELPGVVFYSPGWTADAGVGYRLASADGLLALGGDAFYDLDSGRPYNPATGLFRGPAYTLTAPDGTVYYLDAAGDVTERIATDGQRLYLSDSGIAADTGGSLSFVRDERGRLVQITTPDGAAIAYEYDALGRLVSVHDRARNRLTRYAYDSDTARLITAAAPADQGSFTVQYGVLPQVTPLKADLGSVFTFTGKVTQGGLRAGGTDRYVFSLRDTELTSTASDTVLIAVEVAAGSDGLLSPGLPTIAGATRLVQRTEGGRAFAIFAVERAGLHLVEITGASAATFGGYDLRLGVVGDLNADAVVDGLDSALLAPSPLPLSPEGRGDVNRDGATDAADALLLGANFGFTANRPPRVNDGTARTHESLEVRVPLTSLAFDPDSDPISFRVVGAQHGTARLSPDGQGVIFLSDAGFTGTTTFQIQADDGANVSGVSTVTVQVSRAPLVSLRFGQQALRLAQGGTQHLDVIGDFADEANVLLPVSYLTFGSDRADVAQIDSLSTVVTGKRGGTVLTARRGALQTVTTVFVGDLQMPETAEEFDFYYTEKVGLEVYPGGVTLAPGLTRQILVGLDLSFQTPPKIPSRFFVGDPRVATVSDTGLITAVAAGMTTITVVSGISERTFQVKVEAPQASGATLGIDGGIIRGADGALVLVAPGALEAPAPVSITVLPAAAVANLIPEGQTLAAAFDLDVGPGVLHAPLQLAVPVAPDLAPGTQVWFYRLDQLPDTDGTLTPVWLQLETGFVGADGMARTASPPYSGFDRAGKYAAMLAKFSDKAFLRAVVDATFPAVTALVVPTPTGVAIGTFVGLALAEINKIAINLMVVPTTARQVELRAITPTGLVSKTTVGVQLNKDEVTSFATVFRDVPPTPGGDPREAPQIQAAELAFIPGAGGNLEPVVRLTGRRFAIPGLPSYTGSGTKFDDLTIQLLIGDRIYEVEPILTEAKVAADGRQQIAFKVPRDVAIGGAQIRLLRPTPIFKFATGTVTPVLDSDCSVSNLIRLSPNSSYVFAPLFIGDAVAVLDDNLTNDTSKDPLIARIPVGSDTVFDAPQAITLTPNGARGYVALRLSGQVAVIDTLALQQIDARPDEEPLLTDTPQERFRKQQTLGLNVIELDPGSAPYSAAVDALGRYLYISDMNASFGRGVIHIIDIDPLSPDYHKVVQKISIDNAPYGLRGIAADASGRRLYVTVPDVTLSRADVPRLDSSRVDVINIDLKDRPEEDARTNPKRYRQLIGSVTAPAGTSWHEAVSVSPTDDPGKMVFANRQSEPYGVGVLTVTSDDPNNFQAEANTIQMFLGLNQDYFDVNNATSVVVTRDLKYAFVLGYNRFIAGVPSQDPFYIGGGGGNRILPGGGNVGIVFNPFGLDKFAYAGSSAPTLVAATRPIPLSFPDNVALSPAGSGVDQTGKPVSVAERYLYATYRSTNAVFAFDVPSLRAILDAAATNLELSFRLRLTPIDELGDLSPAAINAIIAAGPELPLAKALQGLRTEQQRLRQELQELLAALQKPPVSPAVFQRAQDLAVLYLSVPELIQLQADLEGKSTQAQAQVVLAALQKIQTEDRQGKKENNDTAFVIKNLIDVRANYALLQAFNQGGGRAYIFGVPDGAPNGPVGAGLFPQAITTQDTNTNIIDGPRIRDPFAFGRGVANRWDGGLDAMVFNLFDCDTTEFNSTASYNTGVVTEAHHLVTYQSLGRTQGQSLVYDSLRANPKPLIVFGFDDYDGLIPGGAGSQYLTAKVDLFHGTEHFTIAGNQGEGDLGAEFQDVHFWKVPATHASTTVALQADLTEKESGVYSYQVEAGFAVFDTATGAAFRNVGVSAGRLLNVNLVKSPFGRGWNLAGLEELYPSPDGSAVLLVDGDGEQLFLAGSPEDPCGCDCDDHGSAETGLPAGAVSYYSHGHGDTSEFVKLPDGTYRRTLRDGTVYQFNLDNKLEYVRDRYGNTTRYFYKSGLLSAITDPVGLTTTFQSDGKRIVSIIDPAGRVTTLQHDGNGQLIAIRDPDGSVRQFTYYTEVVNGQVQANGLMKTEIDKRGNVEEDFYDDAGRAKQARRADGSVLDFSALESQPFFKPELTRNPDTAPVPRDGLNLQATVRDALGRVETITLNEDGEVVRRKDQVGLIQQIERNEMDWITQVTTGGGLVTQYQYDAFGNLTFTSDSLSGNTGTRTEYDPVWHVPTKVTDELGRVTTYRINSRGDNEETVQQVGPTTMTLAGSTLVTALNPAAVKGAYTYYNDGLVRTETDPLGHVTTYFYDAYKRLRQLDFDHAGARSYFYDDAGNTTAIVDENGHVYDNAGRAVGIIPGHATTYRYDAMNRVTQQTDPEGNTQKTAYDQTGLVTLVTDPRGFETSSAYDQRGRLTQQINAARGTTTWQYDAVGNMIRWAGPEGRSGQRFYDARNRVTLLKDAFGTSTRYKYDLDNHVTKVIEWATDPQVNPIQGTQPTDRTTTYGVDLRGRVTSETDAVGKSTTYEYDAVNNRTRVTDRLDHATTSEYDELNRVTRTVNALGHSTVTKYDLTGNVTEVTNERGFTTAFAYDNRNRLTRITDALGSTTVLALDRVGNVTTQTDPRGGTTAYEYDAAHQRTRAIDAEGGTTLVAYDQAVNLTELTDANGHTTRYEYDELNRLTLATDPLGGQVRTRFNAYGQATEVTDANGNTTSSAYDLLGRLTKQTDAESNATRTAYDAVGNLTLVTFANGATIRNEYDRLNRLTAATDRTGHVVRSAYDAVGNLTLVTEQNTTLVNDPDAPPLETRYDYDAGYRQMKETDPLGRSALYAYDEGANLTQATDARGNAATYAYDGLGRKTQQVTADGATTQWAYDRNGNMTRFTDALGRTTRFAYDGLNRLTRTTDALGGSTTRAYDRVGNVTLTTDVRGFTTFFVYDDNDRLRQTTDAAGKTARQRYDAAGNLTLIQDRVGNATTYAYDRLNRVTRVTDAASQVTVSQYDAVGDLTAATDPRGHTTFFAFDLEHRLTRTTDPLGHTTRTAYDGLGNVTAVTDARGAVTRYRYDEGDQRTAVIDALDHTTRTAYDEADNVTQTIDALGRTTRYAYDEVNRLTRTTDANGERRTMAYDDAGQLTQTTDRLGNSTRMRYDELGRATLTIDAEQNRTTTAYDAAGNVTLVTDPLGRETRFAYDRLNRLTMQTDGAGGTTRFFYDAEGHTTAVLDPMGHLTLSALDAVYRLTLTTDAEGGTTRFAYDQAGNLTRQTDANGHTTTFVYDANRIAGSTNALGGTIRTTRDEVGRPTAVTDENGNTTVSAYDLLGRLTEQTDAEGNATRTAYDSVGNVTLVTFANSASARYEYDRLNRVTAATDRTGHVVRSAYDAVGNLTLVTEENGGLRETRYEYDRIYRQTKTTDPLGHSVQSAYDQAGQLTRVTDARGNPRAYAYDGAGRLTRTTFADGTTTVQAYDASGNLTLTADALGRSTRFEYDGVNRLTRTTDALGGQATRGYDLAGNLTLTIDALDRPTFYAYDDLNRLTLTVNALGDSAPRRYDAHGNVTEARDELSNATTYQYDRVNRVTRVTDAASQVTVSQYDAVGDLTAVTDPRGHTTFFAFDLEHRLTRTTDPLGHTTLRAYDAVGNLVSISDAEGRTTRYAYDAADRQTGIVDALNRMALSAYDEAGNLTRVTDPLGRVTRYAYDELNRLTRATDANGNSTNLFYDAADQLTLAVDRLGNGSERRYDLLGRQTLTVDQEGNTTRTAYDAVGNATRITDSLSRETRYAYDDLNRVTA